MNKIEELIARLCPNGVEFKELGEIGELVRGNGLQKADFAEKGVGCIHYGQIYTYYGTFADKTKAYVPPELACRLKKVQKNDLIIATTSENMEDVCKTVAWLGDEEIVTGGHAAIFKHKENAKYLAYYFQTADFFEQKKKYARGTKVIEISTGNLAKIIIPIPPLQIQREIVNILDKFIQLEAELEAELEARRAQYEYYRSKLLTFNKLGGVVTYYKSIGYAVWYTLGEISTLKYGYTEKAKSHGNARFIRITDIGDNGCLKSNEAMYIEMSNKNKEYTLKENDLLVARTGATYGKTLLVKTNEPAIYASFLIKIELDNSKILNQFYWHFAKTKDYWYQAKSFVSEGSQPQFNGNVLRKIKVPVPPLSEQERIVFILDKFDKLVNDISEGLPAEIEARRKQFEYYRGKLLDFKPLATN